MSSRLAMYCNEIIANPSNKMILERPLDDLVKDIAGEKLVYIRTGKVIGEGLRIESITH